ncbi:hypothetical protein FRC17_000884 [Serendipita sp. 399]|nr:hypothetical protein FRC17_000884 [Serendipita sp. 399]
MAPQVGDIVIGLKARVVKENSFHWVIGVCLSHGYAKFHATNSASDLWRFQSEITGSEEEFKFLTAPDLAAIIKIGTLTRSGKTVEDIQSLFQHIPLATNRANGGRRVKFDCVMWLRMALQALHLEGIINCPDAKETINECQAFGEPMYETVVQTNSSGNWTFYRAVTSY